MDKVFCIFVLLSVAVLGSCTNLNEQQIISTLFEWSKFLRNEEFRCTVCNSLVSYSGDVLKVDFVMQQIQTTLMSSCKELETEMPKLKCDESVPMMVEALQKADFQSVCSRLPKCGQDDSSNKNDIPAVVINKAIAKKTLLSSEPGPLTWQCAICLVVLGRVEDEYFQTAEDAMVSSLIGLCNGLPRGTDSLCKMAVRTEVVNLFNEIYDIFLTPESLCTTLSMCLSA